MHVLQQLQKGKKQKSFSSNLGDDVTRNSLDLGEIDCKESGIQHDEKGKFYSA